MTKGEENTTLHPRAIIGSWGGKLRSEKDDINRKLPRII